MNRKPTAKDYITAAGTIIPTIIKTLVRNLYARVRLWVQRNKGCRHCCLLCKYFNECQKDF